MTGSADLRDYALVVGIDKYIFPDLENLEGAGNDAKEFVKWLEDACSDGDLGSGQIISKFAEANYSDLSILVTRLLDQVGKGGRRLYVFLAGHGSGKSIKDAYLYSSEHSRLNQACWDIIQDVTRVGRLFREVILFADCCRTIATDAHPYTMRMQIDSSGAPNMHFYCLGCVDGETVEEQLSDGTVHGIFSDNLLRALHGRAVGAVDAKGQVTAYSLATYLRSASAGLKPDFDPNDDDDYLRKIVLARGFPPRRRTLEIRQSDPSMSFGVFSADLRPLKIERIQTAEDTVLIEREKDEVIVVTVPEVSDLSEASTKVFVLPTESTISI